MSAPESVDYLLVSEQGTGIELLQSASVEMHESVRTSPEDLVCEVVRV